MVVEIRRTIAATSEEDEQSAQWKDPGSGRKHSPLPVYWMTIVPLMPGAPGQVRLTLPVPRFVLPLMFQDQLRSPAESAVAKPRPLAVLGVPAGVV